MAEICNHADVRELASNLARDAKTHAKPVRVLRLAGYIVTSQPQGDVERAADRVAEAYRKAVTP